MTQEISRQLVKLPKNSLVKFIASLYGQDNNLDKRIDTLVLQDDPKALHKALKKRVQSLKRSSRYIPYGESFEFSKQLDALLEDIQSLLLPLSASLAFDLADRFLLSADKTFERVDDSAGIVGDSYRQGVDIWLLAAQEWQENATSHDKKCSENWLERIVTLFAQNDYGVYDTLLPNSRHLLSGDELRQLAWRFEGDARRALADADDSEAYNFEASKACQGVRAVAEALKDIELYERATLISHPEPNDLQRFQLAEYSLQLEQGESALKWLLPVAQDRFEQQRLSLLDKCYQLLQDNTQLLEVRRQLYQRAPNFDSLCALAELLPEEEKSDLMQQAIDDAKGLDNLVQAAKLLLKLSAIDDLERLVLSRAGELEGEFYSHLIDLARALEPFDRPLIELFCYRALLEDILDRAYSKAYGYAVRYYRKIQELDARIDDYRGHPNLAVYMAGIQDKHGRKSSFWRQVNAK